MRVGRVVWSVGLGAALALFAAVYWLGAERHLRGVNVDVTRHDQSAYLDYARQMAESGYAFVGGRNRMPAYPFILSLVYADDLSPEEWFVRGKYLNLVLSLAGLVAIWAISGRALALADATLLTLVVAFSVFVYKAAYTQCEILYYTLLFAVFALMLQLLRRPSAPLASVAGALTGLAYLTKAAVLPLLALFIAWGVIALWPRRARPADRQHHAAVAGQPGFRRAGSTLILLAAFLLTTFPYLSTSKERFGQWFYNVNSTFYIWYDSWDEAVAGTGAHGDTEHWPDLPPQQLPSATRYFREHSIGQIADREAAGLRQILRNLDAPISYGDYDHSFGVGRYLRLYIALVVLAAMLRPSLALRILTAERRWIVSGFAISYFLAATILYAFYVPIAPGPRHFLSLFLPALYCAFLFLGHPSWRQKPLATIGGWQMTPRSLHAITATVLVHQLVFVYPNLIAIAYAGR